MKVMVLEWHPARNNPLDYLYWRTEHKLSTSSGQEVRISQSGTDFVVVIGSNREVTGNNINTCYYLNTHEVGLIK